MSNMLPIRNTCPNYNFLYFNWKLKWTFLVTNFLSCPLVKFHICDLFRTTGYTLPNFKLGPVVVGGWIWIYLIWTMPFDKGGGMILNKLDFARCCGPLVSCSQFTLLFFPLNNMNVFLCLLFIVFGENLFKLGCMKTACLYWIFMFSYLWFILYINMY